MGSKHFCTRRTFRSLREHRRTLNFSRSCESFIEKVPIGGRHARFSKLIGGAVVSVRIACSARNSLKSERIATSSVSSETYLGFQRSGLGSKGKAPSFVWSRSLEKAEFRAQQTFCQAQIVTNKRCISLHPVRGSVFRFQPQGGIARLNIRRRSVGFNSAEQEISVVRCLDSSGRAENACFAS